MGGQMKNQKGQGLTEYLILVAILAVASIGIVRVFGQTITSQFTNITYAIQGNAKEIKPTTIKVDKSLHSNKDLSNFFESAASKNKND
jgi:Flp pilus assembly pilin Flp